MSSDAVLLMVYIISAIGFSFLCSVAEAVLLSITPSYIEGQKEKDPKYAARLKRLKQDNIDQSLAAILTLNTIAHTAGAIGAGAKATAVFGSAWFGVFSAAMTMAILFFSEIVPKTIGAIYWSKLVVPTMYFVRGLIVILFPIVWISEKLTKLVAHGKEIQHFNRDEFIAMAELGKEGGHINDRESRILGNLFRYGSVKVMDVMTPRIVAFALSEEKTVSEVFELIKSKPFSRLPVYKSGFDDITGFVLRDDILLSKASDRHGETLKSLKRDITVVPEKVSLPMLLDSFLNERQHIALVVDEYGKAKGIVTLEDLVETLLGVEIMDEMDSVENMRVLARKMWAVRAKALGIDVERVE